MYIVSHLQDREGERGVGEVKEHDGGGEAGRPETQSKTGHQQGREGQIQVPAEVLPQRSLLPGETSLLFVTITVSSQDCHITTVNQYVMRKVWICTIIG